MHLHTINGMDCRRCDMRPDVQHCRADYGNNVHHLDLVCSHISTPEQALMHCLVPHTPSFRVRLFSVGKVSVFMSESTSMNFITKFSNLQMGNAQNSCTCTSLYLLVKHTNRPLTLQTFLVTDQTTACLAVNETLSVLSIYFRWLEFSRIITICTAQRTL